jgi:predicted ATPase
MKLTHARVSKYRSIEDSGEVPFEADITALVGKNESGKTAFLEGLRRINPADGASFELTTDYPRNQLAAYRRRHARAPDVAVMARFELTDVDIDEVERRFGAGILLEHHVVVRRNYKGELTVDLAVSEAQVVAQVLQTRTDLAPEALEAASTAQNFHELFNRLEPFTANNRGAAVLAQVALQLEANPLAARVWGESLEPRLPRFVAFGDDDVMPSAIAVDSLIDPERRHEPGVATVLALLDLAGVDPTELDPGDQSYEDLKARIESAALNVTDELITYWPHDKELEVMIDVAPAGAKDELFEAGTAVLRIRVGNRRRRTSLPLGERSRGFAWFFSFLVRLCQLGEHVAPTILLLDEPALSLHAGAQTDFLRFLEERLGPSHQVIYSTHSPYMLDPSRLDRARGVVFDPNKGTLVSADLTTIDERTLLPLKAAIGSAFTARILPPGPALLVRDPSDMVWLRAMSVEVERRGKAGLDRRFTVVPVGGAAGLIPYALLSGKEGADLTLLYDAEPGEAPSGADAALLARLGSSPVLKGARIIPVVGPGLSPEVSTLEDLVDLPLWLSLVTEGHKLSPPLSAEELGREGGVVERTRVCLDSSGERFDRLRAAEALFKRAGSPLPPATLERFARLFEALNAGLPEPA